MRPDVLTADSDSSSGSTLWVKRATRDFAGRTAFRHLDGQGLS